MRSTAPPATKVKVVCSGTRFTHSQKISLQYRRVFRGVACCFESNPAIHFQSLVLNHQAIVAFTEAHLDLGPWQSVLFIELDGLRPERILVKVMGE